jgi:hypothetical protein
MLAVIGGKRIGTIDQRNGLVGHVIRGNAGYARRTARVIASAPSHSGEATHTTGEWVWSKAGAP